ncbi:prolyl oligopeptidase family serine peptidase [Sphingomonas colocasiae]|uniref:peptidylprolyl isomerase n=1 Tax=Sphingomonas colocasiae TaxID=1848973 RepID=A0ABS7PSM9_9SPHN|nr:prolyl oligopeptidase family serine peptidase [Sphingomonas colocasiae]MBY8823984.1 prolyl oligopeptidase family serine peptidase [Sphingomonas colocasiae]
MRAFAAAAALLLSTAAPAEREDPYLWMEETQGQRALDWVAAQNARSRAVLEAGKNFDRYKREATTILNDRNRLAMPRAAGADIVNFWQDANNVRGLWRAAERRGFIAGAPRWRTLIDLDALAAREKRNWVWRGAACLAPEHRRCMIALSDGGKDAVTWREFDRVEARFVDGGFVTPEAKTDLVWQDGDHLLLVSDFGAGTLNSSGYGRQLRRWTRGTVLADAALLYEAPATDVWLRPIVERDGATTHVLILRNRTTWDAELLHLKPDGRTVRAPLPEDATYQAMIGDRVIARLQSPLRVSGRDLPAGALVAWKLSATAPSLEPVYVPAAGESIVSVAATRSTLYVGLLHNVAARLVALRAGRPPKAIPVAPDSALALADADRDGNTLFYVVQGLTRPETLYALADGGAPVRIASVPPRFDAARYAVSQHWAVSRDGTRIPYFLVRPKDATGPLPTLINAYGGFRQPSLPIYLPAMAQLWVEAGNAYVIVNVRGGGEFGPAWHAAAIGPGRQKSYDDVHAVAEALRNDRTASRLGIYGGSNGGLLAGAVFLQRPGLYDAVVMSAPLTDMKRYSKLLAGASWMAEYGDPDRAEDWGWLRRYSPYHNIRPDLAYPRPLILTSTKDDRVHPGHARKFAARLEEQGHGFFYYENVDGGHSGTANRNEQAYRTALILSYLDRELGRKPAPPGAPADSAYLHAQQTYLTGPASGPGWRTTSNGLYYRVTRAAPADAPRPLPTDRVTVNYEGRFIDGRVFDSSYARGEPATFPVAGVVRGWREALPMMRVGEAWEIALPAHLGYGFAGRGEIPAGATLVFTIELLAIAR